MILPRGTAAIIVGGLIVVVLGVFDDFLALAPREALAAAALLIWYGPVRRAWKGGRKDWRDWTR
jgi:hypothetical protein